jgi:hypothetical protein
MSVPISLDISSADQEFPRFTLVLYIVFDAVAKSVVVSAALESSMEFFFLLRPGKGTPGPNEL